MRSGRPGLSVGSFTCSHAPLRDDAREVAGFYGAATETTQAVLGGHWAKAERERLGRMSEQSPSSMVALDGRKHRFCLADAAYRSLTGARDLVGKTVREALPELNGRGLFKFFDRIFSTGEPVRVASRVVRLARGKDQCSEQRVPDSIHQPAMDAEGRATGIFVEGSNIAERHRAGEHLRDSEARIRAVFENAGVGVACVTLDGTGWLEVNAALCKMLGYSRADLLAMTLSDLIPPEDRGAECPSFLCRAEGCDDAFVVEGRFFHRNGEQVWVRQTVSLVRNAAGQPDFQIAIIENISEQKNAAAELQRAAAEARMAVAEAHRAALTDALTGLPNRAAFTEVLSRISTSDPCGIIFLDLNGLKRDNDSLGHLAGDEVLNGIAGRLSHLTSPNRFLARVSGDEFVYVVTGEAVESRVRELAEAASEAMAEPFSVMEQTLRLQMAIGYAVRVEEAGTSSDLLRLADLAMYEAKRC